jgi:hypothetical protein
MTQCEKILNYIEEHGSITARQAYKLGIMRLASRISDLRREGHLIKTEDIKVKNRDGSHSYIAKYSFIKKEACSEV